MYFVQMFTFWTLSILVFLLETTFGALYSARVLRWKTQSVGLN
jgi:hypothetical protein